MNNSTHDKNKLSSQSKKVWNPSMPLNITQLDEYFAQLGLGSAVIAGISAGFLLFAFEYGVGYLVKKFVPGAADPEEQEGKATEKSEV